MALKVNIILDLNTSRFSKHFISHLFSISTKKLSKLMSHSTQNRSFWGCSSQPITRLKNRKNRRSKIQNLG